MNCNLTRQAISIVLLVLSGLQWQTPGAFAQAPFYQGKTITVLQGREPGGTGDLRARAVTQFFAKIGRARGSGVNLDFIAFNF
jgi:hypothetical protein